MKTSPTSLEFLRAARNRQAAIFTISFSALFIATCAPVDESSRPNAPIEFYPGQYDAQLALMYFGQQNPGCGLWTNWQKLCSRTNDGGEARCVTDSSMPVEPIRPFCVSWSSSNESGDGNEYPFDAVQRYCATSALRNGKRVCDKLEERRPFNGRHLASLRGPYCRQWSNSNGIVCDEEPQSNGARKCSDLTQEVSNAGPYFCSARVEVSGSDRHCSTVYDLTAYFARSSSKPAEGEDDWIIPRGEYPPKEPAAFGLYCADEMGAEQ